MFSQEIIRQLLNNEKLDEETKIIYMLFVDGITIDINEPQLNNVFNLFFI